MLLVNKLSIFDLTAEDAEDFPYFRRPDKDLWKTKVIQVFLEENESGNWDESYLELINYLCEN